MKLSVKVLHNISRDSYSRYRPDTSVLYHAHDLVVEADSVDLAAEVVFRMTNIGDETDPQVKAYRERMNRSLSVGDVLIFHEQYQGQEVFAGVRTCAGVGWEALEFLPKYVEGSNDTVHSTSYRAYQARSEHTLLR